MNTTTNITKGTRVTSTLQGEVGTFANVKPLPNLSGVVLDIWTCGFSGEAKADVLWFNSFGYRGQHIGKQRTNGVPLSDLIANEA